MTERKNPDAIGKDYPEVLQRVTQLLFPGVDLNPKTRSFLRSLFRRITQHGAETIVTEHQLKTLRGIELRVAEREAA